MNKDTRRITIHVTTRDRATEVFGLLQSLRTQTIQDWDLILLDDGSGTPLTSFHFIQSMITRIRLEGHKVKLLRNNISNGVCAARNQLIEADTFNNPLICRLDDDILLQPIYLQELRLEIADGEEICDISTGFIPLLGVPEIKRYGEYIDYVCEHRLDNEGNLIVRKDELAYPIHGSATLFCDQFRTNCMYKREVTDSGIRYPTVLSKTGFREELWFSFQAIIKGFTIRANTDAIAYHLQTPSGGCRSETYAQNVALDEQTTNEWVKKMYKEHGDFLK